MIYDKDQQGNKIIGSDNKVVTQVGDTAINYSQEIPQWHLDNLKDQRHNSSQTKEGDFMKVASIPVAVVEKWKREGFDILSDRNITGKQIVNKLKSENLDAFLTTEKSL